MGELYQLKDFEAFRSKTETEFPSDHLGFVIYMDPDERVEAARLDEDLWAYCELKVRGFTDVPISVDRIDALEEYPLRDMVREICAKYRIQDRKAVRELIY